MKLLRTLITPVVIAATTVAGLSAAPARAGNDDLAKLLIGLGAIAIVATAAENNRKTSYSYSTTTRNNRIVTIPKSNKKYRKKVSYAVPADCLRTYDASRGKQRRLYSGHCLSKLPYRLADLPAACAYTIMGRHGARGKAYGPRCLTRNGFYRVETTAQGKRDSRRFVYRK